MEIATPTAWARRFTRATGWTVPVATKDAAAALALYGPRPPDVDECPLIDVREAMGAILLWRRHYLDVPIVATVFGVDAVPIVALVGWEDVVAEERVAVIERLVGNPDHPPTPMAFNALDRRWSEVLRQRGLTRTLAHVARDRPEVSRLLRRYGYTQYAEDAQWRWYLRDE